MLNNLSLSLSLSLSSLRALSAISSNLYMILTLRKLNHLAADILVYTFKNIIHSWSSQHIVKFIYREMQACTHTWIYVVYLNNIWNRHQHITAKGSLWKAESRNTRWWWILLILLENKSSNNCSFFYGCKNPRTLSI